MEVIIGKTAGFCYGVKRAVEGAEKQIENTNKKIYCLGEIVHNKEVVKSLENKGIEFINSIEEISEPESKTIIRAHGIPKEIYKKCEDKNIEIQDFTCPNVLKIHDIAEEHNKQGYYIVLVGAKHHPENIGTMSFCGNKMSVIEKIEDVDKVVKEIEKSKKDRCLVIAQTTYHLGKFKEIEKLLKEKLKDIKLEIKNTICMATELRQKETEKLSNEVDKMIIIGGKNSSNTKKLFEIANQNCKEAICVETKKELREDDIKGYEKIGIMAGASTPQESIQEITDMIENINKKERISF